MGSSLCFLLGFHISLWDPMKSVQPGTYKRHIPKKGYMKILLAEATGVE